MSGRKPMDPVNPKTDKVNFRLSTDLVSRLREAAATGGRSLSQEMSRRLDGSFSATDADRFGGRCTYALCKMIALAVGDLREQTGHPWHSDRFTFDHAVTAINEILGYFRPEGAAEVPEDLPLLERLREQGLDPTAAAEEAKAFPFGVLAARVAAFKVEVGVDDPVIQRIRDAIGRRMVGSPQADLLDWRAP